MLPAPIACTFNFFCDFKIFAIAPATAFGFDVVFTLLVPFISIGLNAQDVDYSIISVPEESGMQFVKITEDNDDVILPDGWGV